MIYNIDADKLKRFEFKPYKFITKTLDLSKQGDVLSNLYGKSLKEKKEAFLKLFKKYNGQSVKIIQIFENDIMNRDSSFKKENIENDNLEENRNQFKEIEFGKITVNTSKDNIFRYSRKNFLTTLFFIENKNKELILLSVGGEGSSQSRENYSAYGELFISLIKDNTDIEITNYLLNKKNNTFSTLRENKNAFLLTYSIGDNYLTFDKELKEYAFRNFPIFKIQDYTGSFSGAISLIKNLLTESITFYQSETNKYLSKIEKFENKEKYTRTPYEIYKEGRIEDPNKLVTYNYITSDSLNDIFNKLKKNNKTLDGFHTEELKEDQELAKLIFEEIKKIIVKDFGRVLDYPLSILEAFNEEYVSRLLETIIKERNPNILNIISNEKLYYYNGYFIESNGEIDKIDIDSFNIDDNVYIDIKFFLKNNIELNGVMLVLKADVFESIYGNDIDNFLSKLKLNNINDFIKWFNNRDKNKIKIFYNLIY